MKFNFEGFKKETQKVAKKVALGTGVLLSSVSAVETQGQEKPKNIDLDKTEINKDSVIEKPRRDAEFYRNQYIKYMEHPSYKERLAKEMYGDQEINEESQEIIEDEYQKRLNQIKTISINMFPGIYEKLEDPSYYSLESNDVHTTPYAAPHELTHAVNHSDNFATRDIGLETAINRFVSDRKMTYIKFISSPETQEYRQKMLLFSVIVKNYILENKDSIKLTIPDDYLGENESPYDFIMGQLDELNLKDFTIKKYNEYISSTDREIINKNNQIKKLTIEIEGYLKKLKEMQNNHFYYYKNDEIKARLNHLRIRAVNEFNFNLNNNFDINKFNELKDDQQYKELKKYVELSDEQINELMKYTAENDNGGSSDTYYHPGWNYNKEDQT